MSSFYERLPTVMLAVGTGLLLLFVVYPVAFTLLSSMWSGQPGSQGSITLDNYQALFREPQTYTAIANTLFQATCSAAMAVAIAIVLSVITVRTDTPLRRILFYLPFFPLAFPVLIANQAWIYLFGRRIGLLNLALGHIGLSTSTFDIYSWPGMIWASGMALVPISYITISSGLRNMDPSLEEAGRMSGSGVLQTLSTISVPLVAPSILSAFLLDFTLSAGSFETPTMIGIPAGIRVMMSAIYNDVDNIVPPNYRDASTLSVLMLVLIMILVIGYNRATKMSRKYEVISGRGYSRRVLSIRRWRYIAFAIIIGYLTIGVILPLVTIVMLSLVPIWLPSNLLGHASLNNYVFLLTGPSGALPALFNSLVSALAAATLISAVALLIVFASRRTRVRGRIILESIGMFPIAMPSLVISFGLLWAFLTIPTGLYGSLGVMVIALTIASVSQGIRSLSGGVIQIREELQEASRVSGASMPTTLRTIFFPLLKPTIVSSWLYVFITSFTALGAVVLLASPGNQLFSVLLWSFWSSGNPASSDSFAAGSVLLFAILLCFVASLLLAQRKLEQQ